MPKNLLIVISGPSGVGKGTIVKELARQADIIQSISCTTRAARYGEQDGREYFFITKNQFEQKISDGGFLEYSNHFDSYYGTPTDFVLESLKQSDVVLEIEVNGALQVRKSFPDAVLILIAPPSIAELKKRLAGRQTETAEAIEKRILRADFELKNYDKYDYVVVNAQVENAVSDINSIIRAEKLKSINMQTKIKTILEEC